MLRALGVILLAASVEGLFDGPGFLRAASAPEWRGRAAPSSTLVASAQPDHARRNPVDAALGFVAGFDLTEFGNGVKDFALGGIAGVCAWTCVRACRREMSACHRMVPRRFCLPRCLHSLVKR